MKKTVQKIIFLPLMIAGSLSAQTNAYLQMKFWEALEQANIQGIDTCLMMGADVNALKDGQTPLTIAIIDLIKDKEEALTQYKQLESDIYQARIFFPTWIVAGTMAGLMKRRDRQTPLSVARDIAFLTAHAATAFYALYKCKQFFKNNFHSVGLIKRIESKFAVIKLLLKHPEIDINIKNGNGTTAFDVIDQHITAFLTPKTWEAKAYKTVATGTKEIWALLAEKRTQPNQVAAQEVLL